MTPAFPAYAAIRADRVEYGGPVMPEQLLDLLDLAAPRAAPFGLRLRDRLGEDWVTVRPGGPTESHLLDGASLLSSVTPDRTPLVDRILELLVRSIQTQAWQPTADAFANLGHPLAPPRVAILHGRGAGSTPQKLLAHRLEVGMTPQHLEAAASQGEWTADTRGAFEYQALTGRIPDLDDYLSDRWDRDPEHPEVQSALEDVALRRGGVVRVGQGRWAIDARCKLAQVPREPSWTMNVQNPTTTFEIGLSELLAHAPLWLAGCAWVCIVPLDWAGAGPRPLLTDWALAAEPRRAVLVAGPRRDGLEEAGRQLARAMGAASLHATTRQALLIVQDALHGLKNLSAEVRALESDPSSVDAMRRVSNRADLLDFTAVLLESAAVTAQRPRTVGQLLGAARAQQAAAAHRAKLKVPMVPAGSIAVEGAHPAPDSAALARLLENLLANALVGAIRAESSERPLVHVRAHARGVSIENACSDQDLQHLDDALNVYARVGDGLSQCRTAAEILGLELQLDRAGSGGRAIVQLLLTERR